MINRFTTSLLSIVIALVFSTDSFANTDSGRSNGIYNVLDYGAKADTTTLSSPSIQAAIDACYENGGGTVLVPSGNYLVSSIEIKDYVNLHLDAGSTLFASRDTTDYKRVNLGGKDVPSQEVVLYANNRKGFSITGNGRIHCQAVRVSYQREPVDTTTKLTDFVTGREVRNAARYGADYRTKYRKVPPCPSAINFTDCKDITLKDFSVIESSSWGVHLQWCDRVKIHNLTVESNMDNGVNSDGLDIDGCSRVVISDCIITTGDDALCLKTTMVDGRSEPCRNITVSNCILSSSSSAFKLGTESHSDFENITMTNCVITDANRGINMTIRDGGNVNNVLFNNVVINTRRKQTFWWGNGDPVWLTTQQRGGIPWSGSISNVTFSHIIAHGQSGVRVENFDSNISNIRFYDFQLFMEHEEAVDKRSRDGFLFMNVNGLRLTDCSVTWDMTNPEPTWGEDFVFDNVTDLVIKND